MDFDRPTPPAPDAEPPIRRARPLWLRILIWTGILAVAGVVSVMSIVAIAWSSAYARLPDVSSLQDYRPKLPLRILAEDGTVLGEFGEERRSLTPIKEFPKIMTDAVLAIEDARFYSHGGIDYVGVARSAVANLRRAKSQGASTITMQVARNVFLSLEQTWTRKIYEILLTFQMEHMLTKDQILEIYMNQMFLGNRAYGFTAAADVYFGKALKELTIAEAALLAGIPKAPSTMNPIGNPKRARIRQLHIIDRMADNGYITAEQATSAKAEPWKLRNVSDTTAIHAEFLTETVRQLIFAQYGDDTYTRGLNVYTTIRAADQAVAYRALRKGILDYERRQIYRGPEEFAELPKGNSDPKLLDEAIDDALAEHRDNDELRAAVVLEASTKKVVAARTNGELIEVTGDGLRPVQSGLSDKAGPTIKIRRGAVIRVVKTPKGTWEITQLPEVEGGFVALDPRDGSVRALVGGFDFNKNKFNHVTQAWRQPGSSFKPFIYSAALEKGFSGSTVINDSPLFFDAATTGGQAWEPKNYDGKFDGPMSMRRGLAASKNMVSIRIIQSVGAQQAQDWVSRFGFEAEKHPPFLTMALGAGSVTPMQMAQGYAVFANGGYRMPPFVISRIEDQKGKLLLKATPQGRTDANRAIDARNAFVMTSLMQEITRSGTAAKAQAQLKRSDIYGKTGTTNDQIDAWFVGYHPTVVAAVWIGYDNPRKLGSSAAETGGGLSLPVWISYMEHALRGVAPQDPVVPEGLVNAGGEWYFEEFVRGAGVSSVGLEDKSADAANKDDAVQKPATPSAEEKKSILDLFRN